MVSGDLENKKRGTRGGWPRGTSRPPATPAPERRTAYSGVALSWYMAWSAEGIRPLISPNHFS